MLCFEYFLLFQKIRMHFEIIISKWVKLLMKQKNQKFISDLRNQNSEICGE